MTAKKPAWFKSSHFTSKQNHAKISEFWEQDFKSRSFEQKTPTPKEIVLKKQNSTVTIFVPDDGNRADHSIVRIKGLPERPGETITITKKGGRVKFNELLGAGYQVDEIILYD